ncbi:MAG: hypothetical protein A3G44_11665 [Candidatus Rokubacteria bacterium RIFCSPLOWO2_12_FULL_73_47]|nr:MAG: hypothetical protein A3G44_11665 [Candidatus Rokubacteria bacterium RIFCSPLOWO2_12_FULL_73_47]
MAEHDLEEAPRVVPFLERAAEQRLEVAVDRRERRPELVRDVRHELRAHLLEPTQLGDVVEHHHDAGLRARQAQRHRVHLEPPVGRPGEPELVARDAGRPRRADGPEEVVQGRVADDLEERSALEARRVEAEHGARPLVHQEDRVAPVHREHALDHAVEDRGRLGLLLLEVADLLAEPPHHRVERPAQRADLVGRAHRRARGEVARAHAAGDLLHLDHRPCHAARDEQPDRERGDERHEPARQHHAVHGLPRRRHHGERQREPQDADDPPGIVDGERDVEERGLQRRARPEIASDAPRERLLDLGPPRVVLDPPEVVHADFRVAEHPARRLDQRHARFRRSCRPDDPGPDLPRGRPPQEEPAGAVVEEPAGAREPRLERLDREPLERAGQEQAGEQRRHRDEPDQRQRQLARDAPPDEEDRARQHHSSSNR